MIDSLEYARLSKNAYLEHAEQYRKNIVVDGHEYKVLDTTSSPSGYQATAYQKIDTGEVIIAHRGTEADKICGELWLDGAADLGMVRDGKNSQLDDAMKFTARVIAQVKASEGNNAHPVEITTTGHSLGGTLAEISAYRFGLRGETFNSYGAADLGYGVPEGGTQVVNHVRASDAVSAASRHFGAVRVYATEQDIESLRDGRYLDARSTTHPANPLLSASIPAHFIDNFAPDAGNGSSILSSRNEEIYSSQKIAFDNFRRDIGSGRSDFAGMLGHDANSAHAATLEGQAMDALVVSTLRNGVNNLSPVVPIAASLHAGAASVEISDQLTHVAADAAASVLRAGGSAAGLYAGQLAATADRLAARASATSNTLLQSPLRHTDADPVAALEAVAGIQLTGHLLSAASEGAAQIARSTGAASNMIGQASAIAVQTSGDWISTGGETLARFLQQGARATEHFTRAEREASHDAVHAYDLISDGVARTDAGSRQLLDEAVQKSSEGLQALGVRVSTTLGALSPAGLLRETPPARPSPSGAIVHEIDPHPIASAASRSSSGNDLSARLDRLLAAAADPATFRKETQALADLSPGRALRFAAAERVDDWERRAAQAPERKRESSSLGR